MLKRNLLIILSGSLFMPVFNLGAAATLDICPISATDSYGIYVTDLSSDGTTVVGSSSDSNFNTTGFLWKVGSSPVTSTTVAPGRVNADGSNSFGFNMNGNAIVTLSTGGATSSIAGPAVDGLLSLLAASDDGKTFLAVENPADYSQVPRGIWKYSNDSWSKLGEVNGFVRAAAIGNELISGSTYDEESYAATWTVANGLVNLPKLDGTTGAYDEANYINAAGTLLCGSATDASEHTVGALWKDGQIFNLGTIPGSTYCSANAISDNGITWVGASYGDPGLAIIGTVGGKAHSLDAVLKGEYGIDLGNYTLVNANGISADGLHIAGVAKDTSDNSYHVFRVTLPYVLPLNPQVEGEPGATIFVNEVYDVGGEWLWNAKLGFLYAGYYPFVWINDASNWMYVFGTEGVTDAGYFIFDFKTNTIGWTGYAYYPNYYAFGGASDGQWVSLVP